MDSEKIIKSGQSNLNLCQFDCILNALTTKEAKIAFCAGDESLSGHKFVEVISSYINGLSSWYQRQILANKEREGYNSEDMKIYLDYLVKNSFIQAYYWKKVNIKRWNMDRIKQVRPNQHYVLFGYCVSSLHRPELISKFKSIDDPNLDSEFKKLLSKKKYYLKRHTHGVSIGVELNDSVKNYYFYDNGLNVRHVFSIKKLVERISYPFEVRIFSIDVK